MPSCRALASHNLAEWRGLFMVPMPAGVIKSWSARETFDKPKRLALAIGRQLCECDWESGRAHISVTAFLSSCCRLPGADVASLADDHTCWYRYLVEIVSFAGARETSTGRTATEYPSLCAQTTRAMGLGGTRASSQRRIESRLTPTCQPSVS